MANPFIILGCTAHCTMYNVDIYGYTALPSPAPLPSPCCPYVYQLKPLSTTRFPSTITTTTTTTTIYSSCNLSIPFPLSPQFLISPTVITCPHFILYYVLSLQSSFLLSFSPFPLMLPTLPQSSFPYSMLPVPSFLIV